VQWGTRLNCIAPSSFFEGGDANAVKQFAYQVSMDTSVPGHGTLHRCTFTRNADGTLTEESTTRTAPDIEATTEEPFNIPTTEELLNIEPWTAGRNLLRRAAIKAAFDVRVNPASPRSNFTYFEEAWYFVPLQIALQLQQA